VNKFRIEETESIPPFKIDAKIQQVQSEKLADLRKRRNAEQVNACLTKLKATATSTENLMPIVLECVENFCTLGEIADVLREVFGEYRS
jgi:methylmalonyl-CoA mutase N-terminal domain/subunit